MGYRNTARSSTGPQTTPRIGGVLAAALLLTAISSCAGPVRQAPTSSLSAPEWSSYMTADGSLSFEHPQEWDVVELPSRANDPAGGVSLEVVDAGKRVLARLDTGIITDLSCTGVPEPASYIEYESVPMPGLASAQGSEQRFVYRSLAPAGTVGAQATYAVVSGQQQNGRCGLFNFFTLTETSGGRFAGEYAGATEPESYLDGAARYPESQEYRDLRRMLTSLRNAD